MQYSSKQLDILWKCFLAYQAQFHARDFVTFNPRGNKARFIKIIRALISHQNYLSLGIDIELLSQTNTTKGINSTTLAQMQKLCELIEGGNAFVLKEINADEQASIMSFNEFNSAQWKAHIEGAKKSKTDNAPLSSTEKQNAEKSSGSPRKNTRRRIDPLLALALDVDLQQQSDIQNSFQLQNIQSTEYQNEQQQETQTPITKDPAISFDEFWERLTKDKSLHPLKITKEDLRYQWCHWSAGKNTCTPQYRFGEKPSIVRKLLDGDIQFTADAAMELFKWRHLFQAGIDINHLPAGFTITQSKEKIYLLNYLPKLKEITEPDKLAIQCKIPLSFPTGAKPKLTLEDVKSLFKDYSKVNENSIKHLYDHVLKYFPDKETLLKNDEYMEALQIILNLPPSQRIWWEQLFEQHSTHCGHDDFPSLVTSFQEFLEEITQYHQYFDFYPPKFSAIKSLPVALTQMLALLDQSKNEDRKAQWNCITELQLTGYEVGAALRSSYFSPLIFNEVQKPCSFITPAMTVEEIKDFKGRYDLLFPSNLNWFQEEDPPEHHDSERLFYLALSHKQFRLPLCFYQEKIKAINKASLDAVTKKRLYNMLLESCTGAKSQFILKSPEQISSDWDSFLSTIKSLGKEKANLITNELFKFTDVPEIHLLNTIIASITTKKEGISQPQLKETIFYLNRLSEQWDTRKAHHLINKKDNTTLAHLWDMKVCFKDRYQESNYLSLALVFDFLPALVYTKKGKRTYPGSGEAHFNEELSEVLDERKKDERSYFLAERILDKLSCLTLAPGKPHLTVEQFITFSKAVFKEAQQHQTEATCKSRPDFQFYFYKQKTDNSFETFYQDSDFIERILREQFPEYVDESLLELSELTTEDYAKLELKIKAAVKDKSAQAILKSILTELSFDRSRKAGHSDLVDKLIILTNNYPGEERAEFLLGIRNHLAFGKLLSKESNRGFESRLDQFNELLQTIIDTGSITRFQFLMAEFEELSEPNNRNIIKKLSYSLSRLLALMNEALASNPQLQSTEQLLFCKEFISAQSAHALIHKSNQPKSDETLYIEMIQAVNRLSKHYPTHARGVNAFFINCYQRLNKEELSSSIPRTTALCEELSALNDPDLVLSIIHNFRENKKDHFFTIQNLEHLFKHCPNKRKGELLRILIGQNNQNPQSIKKDTIDSFLGMMNKEQTNDQFSEALKICFSQLPLPNLEVFTQWWTDFQKDNTFSIKDKYQDFIKHPFPRDEHNNGFIIEKALSQVKSKEMANIASRYTPQFIEEYSKNCAALRDLSLQDLMSTLGSVRNNEDPSRLAAAMAELLFRSTGQEINTTQYLALDALLATGKHITSEIDTGEGKTRIAMLLLACQAYSGQTCDFVTSDMQLAETAYLSYNSFFKMLGIQSKLIRSESNISEYQPGAIHFSDCGNLSLFRNKATAVGQLDKTLDPDPKRRTLLLDESDKTWFDLYDTSYHFSMPADKSLEDIDWVYTQLVQFFSEDGYHLNPEIMEYYYEDVAQCTKKFREFVKAYGSSVQVAQLNSISNEQIARWHESAVTALSLRYEIDFVLEPNSRVKTHKGPKVASEALVVADNQVNRHSKFSNGVHQCLHARLNILRHKDIQEEPRALDKYLHERCTQAFHIAPENQIITSSSSEAFLNFYTEGNTYGMTGTAGAETEKREVEEHFGIAEDPNKRHFIKMPRERENLRIDNPLSIVPQNKDKIALLIEHIIEAQSKNQPVLVFCDNDREASVVMELLKNSPKALAQKIALHQIKSTTPTDEQSAYLANEAGKPGAVTISTGMLGRGKDILLHSTESPQRDAGDYGLRTIDLSYPNYRELLQRLGRAARNGQPGETYILLSEEELKTKYKIKYSETNLKLIEDLLLKRQRFETDKNQLERRIKMSLHEYLGQYQKAYFTILLPMLKRNNITLTEDQSSLWVNLFNEMILTKQKTLNDLMGMIHNPSFSAQKYQLITDELHAAIKPKWDALIDELVQDSIALGKIKPAVNQAIHKVELKDWEKRRILEIKNEQLRPFRERIVMDEIKSRESFWVFLNRMLFEFAKWISWDSMANYLDKHFHFSRSINDIEIEPLVYSPEEPVIDISLGSYSTMLNTLGTNSAENEQEYSLGNNPIIANPLHTDVFNPNVQHVDSDLGDEAKVSSKGIIS